MTALAFGAALVLTGGAMMVCAVLRSAWAVVREDERHD